jgi:hypothetical protein
MIKIDKSALSKAEGRSAPYREGLLDYAEKVALEKPKCTFMVDDDCVRSFWVRKPDSNTAYEYDISTIVLCDEGERVGAISVNTEYREGKEIVVYGVESFRIQKYRGNANKTVSKHLNVAIRNVKKFIKGRDYSELASLIKSSISNNVNSLRQATQSRLSHTMDTDYFAVTHAMRAYQARKAGHKVMEVDTVLDNLILRRSNQSGHDKACEDYKNAFLLNTMLNDKKGYGISVYSNGSLAVYSFANDEVRKYQEVSELDPLIQTRLAMFKVISDLEPYAHLGCKFVDSMYYIVEGDLDLES